MPANISIFVIFFSIFNKFKHFFNALGYIIQLFGIMMHFELHNSIDRGVKLFQALFKIFNGSKVHLNSFPECNCF